MLLMVNLIRLLLALVPAFFGVILLCASLAGQFVGEVHEGHARKSAVQAKGAFYVAGQPEVKAAPCDRLTNVLKPGLLLVRHVKYFEWREQQNTCRLGRMESTQWFYHKQWTYEHHASKSFKHPQGHMNPMPRIKEARFGAQQCKVNGVLIPSDLLEKLPAKTFLPDAAIYYGRNPSEPEIGDATVTYTIEPFGPISAIGTLSGGDPNSLVPYVVPRKEPVYLIQPGIVSRANLFHRSEGSDEVISWALRLVCCTIDWVAFSMIVTPLSTLASFVVVSERTNKVFFALLSAVLAPATCTVVAFVAAIFA